MLTINTYCKGESRTAAIIPTKKRVLGEGVFGRVYEHRTQQDLVVKKNKNIKYLSLKSEFEIGIVLDHPNLMKVKALWIKYYPDQSESEKEKLVLEKIHGFTLEHIFRTKKKTVKIIDGLRCQRPVRIFHLSGEQVLAVLQQAQSCCMYLFDKKFVWRDINPGNIFVTDCELKLGDFAQWQELEEDAERAFQLLIGAIELVGWTLPCYTTEDIKFSTLAPTLLPQEFFEEAILSLPNKSQRIFSELFSLENNKQIFSKVYKRFHSCPTDQLKKELESYFDKVIEKFPLYQQQLQSTQPLALTP